MVHIFFREMYRHCFCACLPVGKRDNGHKCHYCHTIALSRRKHHFESLRGKLDKIKSFRESREHERRT